MLMIKVCVFDMDGLLIDSERQMYAKTGAEVSKELGRPVDMDFLTAQMGGSFKAYEEHLLERYGADYPLEEYWKRYLPFHPPGHLPDPGIEPRSLALQADSFTI